MGEPGRWCLQMVLKKREWDNVCGFFESNLNKRNDPQLFDLVEVDRD
jgi:hypothetical protein